MAAAAVFFPASFFSAGALPAGAFPAVVGFFSAFGGIVWCLCLCLCGSDEVQVCWSE